MRQRFGIRLPVLLLSFLAYADAGYCQNQGQIPRYNAEKLSTDCRFMKNAPTEIIWRCEPSSDGSRSAMMQVSIKSNRQNLDEIAGEWKNLCETAKVGVLKGGQFVDCFKCTTQRQRLFNLNGVQYSVAISAQFQKERDLYFEQAMLGF